MERDFDIVVVGAGIVGLGVALAATRLGLRIAVVERSSHAIGASIRNFGFVTITGQQAGAHWARARRSRDVWAEIAPQAGIDIVHAGLIMPAYRQEAEAVVEAFLETDMGEACSRVTPVDAQAIVPALRRAGMRCALYSPHELRMESSTALPKLAAWLHRDRDVQFFWNTTVHGVDGRSVETSFGLLRAEAVVLCPGDNLSAFYPERLAAHGLSVCTLQMMRVAPARPVKFGAAVMSDLSFARYEGFAALPAAAALADRLDAELPEMRREGIHVIAVQSADGSLVVGDSHTYGTAPKPFAEDRIDQLILEGFDQILDLAGRAVIGRWIGSYAYSQHQTVLVDRPAENIRLVLVTGGTGASTAFGLGEEVMNDLNGTKTLLEGVA